MLGDVTYAPPNTAGIVAIGLTAEEDLNVVGESDDDPDPVEVKKGRHHGAGISLYPLIDDVAPGRSAVIQATGDKYLPAAQARALFGADTALRRFYEVPANRPISAEMPCGAPTSLTRAMNAGGKLYSRPQIRPTFFGASLIPASLPPSASFARRCRGRRP